MKNIAPTPYFFFGTKAILINNFIHTFEPFLQQKLISVSLNQTHSDNICLIEEPLTEDTTFDNYDAVISTQSNILLSIKTADCVPMIFADAKKHFIAISHQGWRGCLSKLPIKVISKMIELGSKKEDILIYIGPAIKACCYKLYGERFDLFYQKDAILPSYIHKNSEHYMLDLQLYISAMLTHFGILESNISTIALCTKCNSDVYYSYQVGDKSMHNVSAVVQI
ncbi:MAG: polyphenol oxidase family protein [Candidatus Roizmanbacteria bacterium]